MLQRESGRREIHIENLPKKIRLIRSQRKLTSAEAAENCGLNRSVYSRIETGKKVPKINELAQIARGLNTTVTQLLDEDLKLSDDIQQIVAILERLPEPSRLRMLELLEAGALAPEASPSAAVTLLQHRRNIES